MGIKCLRVYINDIIIKIIMCKGFGKFGYVFVNFIKKWKIYENIKNNLDL